MTDLDLVPLLRSQIEPQVQAKEFLDAALARIDDDDSQGRFLLLTLHICLAASRHQIRLLLPGGDGTRLADDFERFVISQTWDRPTTITEADQKKLFRYTESSIGDLGQTGNMEDVGLTLLSLACPNTEEFDTAAVMSAGLAAKLIWDIAATTTERLLPTPQPSDPTSLEGLFRVVVPDEATRERLLRRTSRRFPDRSRDEIIRLILDEIKRDNR